jgi:hypothetical protein
MNYKILKAIHKFSITQDLWTWTKVCSCFGGICFVVSDSILGINKFFVEIPHSQVVNCEIIPALLGISCTYLILSLLTNEDIVLCRQS